MALPIYPYLQKSIDAAQSDTFKAMNPMFQSQQRASGAYGNSGLGEAQTTQMTNAMDTISNNARMQNYNQSANLYDQGLNRSLNAAFNTPQFGSASMGNYGTLFNAANTMNQANWAPLQNYGSMVGGNYGSTTQSPTYTNPWGGALGGAMAGSSIYNSLFNK